MTEFNKMRSGQLVNITDASIKQKLDKSKKKVFNLNQTYFKGPGYLEALRDLIPSIPKTSLIAPPFFCDYGCGVVLGESVFINANCTFLDGAEIRIGDFTLIGPNVQLYTPQHPFDAEERRKPIESCYPITIGKDCWIGGGVVICPGVTLGDRVIVGAGSVVTKDVASDTVVAGVPAKFIRDNRKVD